MDKGIHFISGMPRSGTTLLAAILNQNPHFHAGMSTPVAAMFGALQTTMSGKSEFHPFIDDDKRSHVLRGIFSSYYADIHADKTVFDTNRSWTSKLPALARIFEQARIVVCVRSIVAIIESIERIAQQNPLEPSRMFGYSAKGNIYSRADTLLSPEGLVGAAYNGLKEAFYGAHSDRIVVVPYESLVRDPEKKLRGIYAFLGLEYFPHDFDNLAYSADEFDRRLGVPGLHRIKPRVEAQERERIVPPDLAYRYIESAFWEREGANPKKVRIL